MHFYFIGVTTQQSAMVRIFPHWAKELNLDLSFVGIDLPLDATASDYITAVTRIKEDPLAIGSVVTTHKTKVYEHAAGLFDRFDALANITKEVCSISKRDGLMEGLAGTDCLSTTYGLADILGENYWKEHPADLVCLGAGGVARSLALSTLCDFRTASPFTNERDFVPQRMVFTDIDDRQLQSLKELLEPFAALTEFHFLRQSEAEDNDVLVSSAKSHSLIINATGMGKDRPGSPLTDRVRFPKNAIAWDLNYRGEREFLKQARAQDLATELTVHDGWLCFMHGWTQSLQASLNCHFSREQFNKLVSIAASFRTN